MANPYFQFKKFTVWHDKCAMKVGTDGVLLGAWADVTDVTNVLDVGTGTGLISLMIAQRSPESTHITAVEIDQDAAFQASENVDRSPWKHKICVKCSDFKHYCSSEKFDLIVSNPPYFIHSLTCPDEQRSTARHTDTLSYEELITHSNSLLTENGKLMLIFPTDVYDRIVSAANKEKLYPQQVVHVITTPNARPKRVLACFTHNKCECSIQELLIEESRHVYSKDFTELVKDFYLKL